MDLEDIDGLWEHLQEFKYKNMLTLKNLDNDLPTESWDSMYHTGLYLTIAALRLKRTRDESIVPLINETLDVIIEEGINFRGFNSDGEYWHAYMRTKYYPIWGDKEVFRDTSRDQVLALTFGLYFLTYALEEKDYSEIYQRVKKITKIASDTLLEHDYDLGTTYGNCKTYEIPLSLTYRSINDDIDLRKATPSKIYFRIVPALILLTNWKRQYFSYELNIMTLFLIINAWDANDETYSETVRNKAVKYFGKQLEKKEDHKNLFWELLYYHSTGELYKERDFSNLLREIFSKFGEKKNQDFIWQRHPKFWYQPREEEKNFYAPYHDYLIMIEMLEDLGL